MAKTRTRRRRPPNPAAERPLRLEYRRAGDLPDNPNNWRRHPEAQLAALRDLLAEVGWAGAVLFNERTNRVIDGHARKSLDPDAIVPVLVGSWPEGDELKVLATFDPVGAQAQADGRALQDLLARVATSSEPLNAMLAGLAKQYPPEPERTEPLTDPEDIPEPPAEPVTRPGDLWRLGRHRLLCGDATRPEDLDRLLDGARVELLLTDPPYGVNYVGRTAAELTIANDDLADDAAYRRFLTAAFEPAIAATVPGGSCYIWHADSRALPVRQAAADAGLRVRQCLVWVKQSMVLCRQDYHWQHEPCLYGYLDYDPAHDPCLYGWKEGASHTWLADRKQTTVLSFDRPSRNADHPTAKPVALFAYLLANSCPPRGRVLDPFAGSGTTVVAAELDGRTAYLVELDPGYVDVAVRRWEAVTGRKAEREK